MTLLKNCADFLTFSRLFIAAYLAWLGWGIGEDGLAIAAILMIASWASDIIDGYLARRSKVSIKTWIGEHDLYFDMAVAVGLLVFMAAAGYIDTTISVIYILVWCALFWRFGIQSALGKLFQAPIYAWFIFVTFKFAPIFGWIILFFLLVAVGITWPRFPKETIPDFLSGFGEDQDSTPKIFEEEHQGTNNSLDENPHHL